MKITHYDLFAGIGGFSLALEEVFNEAKINHIFCEWAEFPSAVLKKHWPNGTFYGDIADLVTDTERTGLYKTEKPGGSQESKEERRLPQHERLDITSAGVRGNFNSNSQEHETLTILTGGFPCQPFSHAGRRKGTADDRYQWPNMFRVVQNIKPDWIIAENVRGFVTWNDGMVLEQVCADLESESYEVQPFIIPAVAVNAPHRRDRIWIIAHAEDKRNRAGFREIQGEDGEVPKRDDDAKPGYADWHRDWREVAASTCNARMDDGLSRKVDGISYSFAKWRNESIKAYGNAIVPQVAMEIFRAIKMTVKRKVENDKNG